MATLTLRTTKGSPLTSAEVDDNFLQLDLTKIQLAGDLGGSTSSPTVTSLHGRSLSSASPTTGQAIVWNGTSWIPGTVSASGLGAGSSTVTSTTTGTSTTTINTGSTSYPAFSAFAGNTDLQTITPGSQQKVLFQVEEFDTANCYGSSRFTPNVAGYYQLNAEVRFDGNVGTGNEIMLAIWKNGAEYKRGWNSTGVSPATNWFSMQVGSLVYANGTTDYFEIYAQHGNSGNLTITGVTSTGITYFNGIFIPNQIITSVSASTTVVNAVTSSVVQGGGYGVTVLDDITDFITGRRQIFTLKNNTIPITHGLDYGDNKDFTVTFDGRMYNPLVPQVSTLGPWIVEYTAGKTYEFKVSGSKLILYRWPKRNSAQVRINTVSASRQTRRRYPFTANTIVFGD